MVCKSKDGTGIFLNLIPQMKCLDCSHIDAECVCALFNFQFKPLNVFNTTLMSVCVIFPEAVMPVMDTTDY